jgi:hypothetical protein
MPDHDVAHAADSDEPGISSSTADLQDADLRREIELVGDLVLAASASDRPLSVAEIDQILGVRPA